MSDFTEHQRQIIVNVTTCLQDSLQGQKLRDAAWRYIRNATDETVPDDDLFTLLHYAAMKAQLRGLCLEYEYIDDYTEHEADYLALLCMVVESNLHVENGGIQ